MNRTRGLDLLRLYAGMAVIMLHYNYGFAFPNIENVSVFNYHILYFLEALCIPAVNVFLLISGFFLYKRDDRSLGKVINLFLMVVFARVFFYLVTVINGETQFDMKLLINSLIPNAYFVVLYVVVYLLSPYYNIVIKHLSSKGVSFLVILLLLLLSVEPFFLDVLEKTTGNIWHGMSFVSYYGGGGGQTLVHFSVMYIIGASINRISLSDKNVIKTGVSCFVVSTLAIYVSYSFLNSYIPVPYYSPFVIIQSVSLFYIFKDINCKKIVSDLSKAALMCYLIQFPLLSYFKVEFAVIKPSYFLIGHIIFTLSVIYFASFLFMKVYDLLFMKITNYLNKYKINYN